MSIQWSVPFRDCSMRGVSLLEARFGLNAVIDCNLTEANLSGSTFDFCWLEGLDLSGANLTGCVLTYCGGKNLKIDTNTILPNGQRWDGKTDIETALNITFFDEFDDFARLAIHVLRENGLISEEK